jgi:hypothetical protein
MPLKDRRNVVGVDLDAERPLVAKGASEKWSRGTEGRRRDAMRSSGHAA